MLTVTVLALAVVTIIDTHDPITIDIITFKISCSNNTTMTTIWSPMSRTTITMITTTKKRKKKNTTFACVYTANRKRPTSRIFRCDVTNAPRTFAMIVTGVMNIKRITKYASAIDAMAFIAVTAMKWTSVMIVTRWCARPVPPSCRVNFAAVVCVRIVRPRVDGTWNECVVSNRLFRCGGCCFHCC